MGTPMDDTPNTQSVENEIAIRTGIQAGDDTGYFGSGHATTTTTTATSPMFGSGG
jgi:hypothetical protein